MKDYIHRLIHMFVSGEYSKEATSDMHHWLVDDSHTSEKEDALSEVWKETEGQKNANIWPSLSSIYDKIGYETEAPRSIRRFFWRYAAAAIVLVAISSAATYFFTSLHSAGEVAIVENETSIGKMKQVVLPDGSCVQTNSSSILLYPEKFDGSTRTVFLIGQANFKVKKNPKQPFVVRSTTFSVTALGTEFDVSAYPDSRMITATLIHGKVRVDCNEHQKNIILMPEQRITYEKEKGKVSLSEVDLEDATAWQRGVLVFRGVQVKQVLHDLERRYAVAFVYNQRLFNKDRFNFRFNQNASIGEVMEVMKEVVGNFSYRINGDICYLGPSNKYH